MGSLGMPIVNLWLALLWPVLGDL